MIGETRGTPRSVVEESAVAVDLRIDPFEKDFLDLRCLESRSQLSAEGSLDAVDRPQDLFQPSELYPVSRPTARMAGREASVIGRVPVLGGDDSLKSTLKLIGDRDYLVAARHSQGPTGKEVVLEIDDEKGFHDRHHCLNQKGHRARC